LKAVRVKVGPDVIDDEYLARRICDRRQPFELENSHGGGTAGRRAGPPGPAALSVGLGGSPADLAEGEVLAP
jgi:hypothetical protein